MSRPGSPPDDDRRPDASRPGGEPIIRVEDVDKHYGPTHALAGASLSVAPGEIVGLVGHNGAGKSTLMRVLCGLTLPDTGRIFLGGQDVAGHHSFAGGRRAGIRIAFQELSLCSSLRTFENVLVAHPQIKGWAWRRRAARLIRRQLDEMFPDHRISARARVMSLTLAQRQMLEIARAAAPMHEDVRMLILDEPTSALGAKAAESLFAWLARRRAEGLAAVVISHRLREVVDNCGRTVVMRDGRVVADRPSEGLTSDEIVDLMGQAVTGEAVEQRMRQAGRERQLLVEVDDLRSGDLQGVSLQLREGEVVGLAGLDGQGQRELLGELWRLRRRRVGAVRAHARMAFVSGDRQESGLFPLWSLTENVSLAALGGVRRFGLLRPGAERRVVREWIDRLAIRSALDDPITGLSGGTQQKAVIARALASGAPIVLLDDPFRGVDVGTKRDAYRLIHDQAADGRCFLWFTTENDELQECDRVYVFRDRRIVAELVSDEIREDRVIAASFADTGADPQRAGEA